jgi:hypothetical protein
MSKDKKLLKIENPRGNKRGGRKSINRGKNTKFKFRSKSK